ncbi:MAG: ribose-phosphate pyrophosphokinase [Candidatus Brocadiae bacterium]|nr:ribose-phosphate pyrophosphokinase [Candidatus Brocadiia bacterium]
MRKKEFQIFTGNSNRRLAERIAKYLELEMSNAEVSRFPDGEIDVKIGDDVRGADVFLVQPTSPPVNENLMELLIMIDALRRASAERITAVIPYFGYARQDRKAEGRVPISAKLCANLITRAGADRVMTMDLHAAQIQGFFDIPVDHLYAAPVLIDYVRKKELQKPCVLCCDVGGAKMARAYAKRLGGAPLAIIDKRRTGPSETEVAEVIGTVEGHDVVVVDDMISTGTSIAEAARVARERGARSVRMVATHAVLCGKAMEKIEASKVEELVITDSVPITGKERPWIKTVTVAELLGEAIRRIHKSESVSSLFV